MRNQPLKVLPAAAVLLLSGCTDPTTEVAPSLGGVGMAITVQGLQVETIDLNLWSDDVDPAVSRHRELDVSGPGATVSALEAGLPAGSYTVALSAMPVDDPATEVDESTVTCAGQVSDVVVTAGEVTSVEGLVLLCTLDGGQVQQAGGIHIVADVDYEEVGVCGDLLQALSIAPLSATVGQQVAIALSAAPGAQVAWEADHGVLAADGTSFTCPDVPGTYEIELTLTNEDGCEEQWSQTIDCHSPYAGECETLPTAFAFEGCGLRSPCVLTQSGCSFEAECRWRTFRGEALGANDFPFVSTRGDVCTGSVVDDQWVGSCTDSDGDSCEYTTVTDPDPVADCEKLPETISGVTACGVQHESCQVVQEGCRFQALCDDQVAYGGWVDDTDLGWWFRIDGSWFRCLGPLGDGGVVGSCIQSTRSGEPATCDNFSVGVEPIDLGDCPNLLQPDGFALEGCGFDGIHFAKERGCVWSISGEALSASGISAADNDYSFQTEDGRSCAASVIEGRLQGICQGAGESCAFNAPPAAAPTSCTTLPATIASTGCGDPFACSVFQDGCRFGAKCADGDAYLFGDVSATGVTFPGIDPGWECYAELNAEGTAMDGDCDLANADGTITQCGEPLQLTWP